MNSGNRSLMLSRGAWTLARYLAERSPAPLPPIVRADDDALHVAKLAISAPLPRAVYVVDADGRYLGTILDGALAHEVFEHLNPTLFLEKHPHSKTRLFHLEEDASKLTAQSLIGRATRPARDQNSIAEAMEFLYRSESDELPIVNDDGQIVGVIRALDILREWVEDTLLVQLGDETESFY